MKKIKFLILAVLGTALASGAKAGIIEVESGGDIRAALRKASEADTVLLKAGEYTLPSQIEQTKDIVLMGESGKMPVVNFTNFVLGTGADKLVLDGIHIIYNRKYLVYNANEKDVEIGLIAVRNCIVNLNGENGARGKEPYWPHRDRQQHCLQRTGSVTRCGERRQGIDRTDRLNPPYKQHFRRLRTWSDHREHPHERSQNQGECLHVLQRQHL